jgi:hypothetical protein
MVFTLTHFIPSRFIRSFAVAHLPAKNLSLISTVFSINFIILSIFSAFMSCFAFKKYFTSVNHFNAARVIAQEARYQTANKIIISFNTIHNLFAFLSDKSKVPTQTISFITFHISPLAHHHFSRKNSFNQ